MSMAWLRQRPARVPTWVIDAGWAVAVAVAVTIAIRGAREPGTRRPDLIAYVLGLTLGALLLARRRWPVAVLVASFAALQLYYMFNYPGISAAVQAFEERGVEHSAITDLPPFGIAVLPFKDPDGLALELTAPL